jgi:hypothetical protein
MAPARILASQPPHERAHLSRDGWAPALTGRLSPLPAHQRAMPAQEGPRSDQAPAARGAWQVASRRRQPGTIRDTKLRPRHLAAQDLELVTNDEQLDVLDVQPARTPNERAQQRPEREVDKRERHDRRSSQPAPQGRDTSNGTLHAASRLLRQGINSVGIERIIKEGQVTLATFYRHLPSKVDLVVAYPHGAHDHICRARHGAGRNAGARPCPRCR